MIDRIRHDIQQRLDQLLTEADKLRRALTALDPRERSTREAQPPPPAPRAAKTTSPERTPARHRASASTRTPPGETKANVLAALSSEEALTASQVAAATGLARPTVSTTLSRLAKTGDVIKADRGYRLPSTNGKTE